MNENSGNGVSGNLQFDEEMCERYIFGELSPTDQERFEETYFTDDAFFERYIAVKTELLDLLDRDELSPEKRSRMEPHFQATAPRRRRIEESALFTTSITAVAQRRDGKVAILAPPTENDGLIAGLIRSITAFFSSPRFAAVAVLILAVTGGLYFLNRSSSDNREDVTLVLEDAPRPQADQLASPIPGPTVKEGPSADKPQLPAATTTDRSTDNKDPKSDSFLSVRPRKTPPDTGQKTVPAPSPSPAANERASTGFALTLSTVGRDNGRQVGPVATSGLNIGGKRGPQNASGEGLTQSIVLSPGATRDRGKTDTLVLRSGNNRNWAAITLLFRGELYPDYVVTITNMAGKVVLKEDDFAAETKADGSNILSVWIDETSAFKESEKDYIVTLQGKSKTGVLETIEEYYFHVQRIITKPAQNAGQLLAAELSGTVLDPNGKPVAKATVTAKNLTTGITRSLTSRDDGTYQMVQLPPGDYEVHAEAATLKRAVIKDLSLTADSRVELPISMEAGVAESIVNVEGRETVRSRLSIVLEPMFAAGSKGIRTVELHGDSQQADFRLAVPGTGHSTYKAILKTVSGKTILSRSVRKSSRLTFSVRSKVLRTGDYVIELNGRSKSGSYKPVAEFYFHVRKSN